MNNSSTTKPTEPIDYRFWLSMFVFNALNGVLATVLNSLVVLTFLMTPSLRKAPSNLLILNLAITDLSVGFLIEPFYCMGYYKILIGDNSLPRGAFPEVFSRIDQILVNASLLTVTSITIDRFLALRLHLKYQELVTTRLTSFTLISIWLSSFVWAVVLYFLKDNHVIELTMDTMLLSFILLVNIALMLKISSTIDGHVAQLHTQMVAVQAAQGAGNIKKSVNVMYCILGSFMLCYFPFICVWFVGRIDYLRTSGLLMFSIVTQAILYANSSLNAVIYFLRLQEMRNAARKMLSCSGRSNRRHNNLNHHDNPSAENVTPDNHRTFSTGRTSTTRMIMDTTEI